MYRQCSSCGGFCKKSGCERENVKPKEWVGLTDEEIDELHGSPMSLEHGGELKWVRIIEAKLKDKNT